ncbi:50S ribosomal protein L24 [Candidatus Gracilibacteria bacterium]|nr:50S ribosomal protein L24 [Candidatus Gracilibacteria bacterium]
MKIRSGDKVVVIAGKDKGKEGKILSVDTKNNRVLVENINIVTKHIKKQGTTPGQIVKVEKSLDASNVMILCPTTSKPTRIGFKIEGNKKTRVSKKSGKNI